MGLAEDKVVVVTGAASGMGRAGAELFAAEGAAHVYVVDLDPTGEEVAASIGAATFVRGDVSDPAQVAALFDRVVDEHGRLDCAWNNAGITDASQAFTELSFDAWERMLRVNLTSVFLCMQAELRHMAPAGRGAIVNTSSGAGVVAAPGLPHYTAAKHGVVGLTKSAAAEYNGAGVRVNAVLPGMVDTPMIRSWFDSSPDIANLVKASLPGKRLGEPSQVAEAAVWLCSDRADWVSGVSMVVDGGGVNR